MTEARNRSPEEWQREIERTRADIDRTLTALRARISRGALLDRMIRSMRDGGGEFAAGIGRTIRDNPVPAVVLGAGLAWLVMAGRSRNDGPRAEAGPKLRHDPHCPPTGATATVTAPTASAEIADPAAPGTVENGGPARLPGGI